jgi:chemotaxis protein methyltransferase CheR
LNFRRERWGELEAGLQLAAPALEMDGAEQCARWIVEEPIEEPQLQVLAQALTVGETYFCRDNNVFRAFEREILPDLVELKRRRERRLRIWSAACCTGEEPYTIAMILKKAIPDLMDWNVTILATDVNPHFLRKASEGIYGSWSFRRTPEWIRRRHFTALPAGRFELYHDIRRMVTFSYLNLAESSYPSVLNHTNAMDFVFCRNVLMYFDLELVEIVTRRLQASLMDGGWLVVGRSETVPSADGGLTNVEVGGERWYRKGRGATAACLPSPRAFQPPVAESPPRGEVARPQPKTVGYPPQVDLLYELGDYSGVREALVDLLAQPGVKHSDRHRAMRTMAHACANLGRLDEAQEWCEAAIAENNLDARLHFLLASVLLERDRTQAAEQSLQHALAIDENFVLAHFTLGNLARRREGMGVARAHFERTLSLLRAYRSDEILPASDGLTAGRLSQIAAAALAQC